MVLNASFLSLHANSGLFWVPMPKTARQEVLGWDGARAAGLAWGGDWGGGVGWGRGGQREEGFGWGRAQEHGSYLLTFGTQGPINGSCLLTFGNWGGAGWVEFCVRWWS